MPLFRLIDDERIVFIEKSRTMMATWGICGYFAHTGFTQAARKIVFQSRDEERAVHCIKNIKCLWEQSDPELRERWPLLRPMESQAYLRLAMANGSEFVAIPGDPDKVRSEHPTAIVFDEAAFIERFADSYNTAIAARPIKMVALSSAEVGDFYEMVRVARPTDWPDSAMPDAA